MNYDDYAFEVVGPSKSPMIQLVIAKDYSMVYLNARLTGDKQTLILKHAELSILGPEAAKNPRYNLDRIFKYPSYMHEGERD